MISSRPTIQITAGASYELLLRTPWDLTGHAIACQIRDTDGAGALIASPAVTSSGNPSIITIPLTAASTSTFIPGRPDYTFDIKITAPSGSITYTPRCWLNVVGRVTL